MGESDGIHALPMSEIRWAYCEGKRLMIVDGQMRRSRFVDFEALPAWWWPFPRSSPGRSGGRVMMPAFMNVHPTPPAEPPGA